MSTNVLIGQRLRAERQRLQLTQVGLADAASVSKTSQINYEAGTRSPDANYLAAVAERGVDVLFVVTGRYADPRPNAETRVPIPLLDTRAITKRGTAAAAVSEGDAQYLQLSEISVSNAWLARRNMNPANLRMTWVPGAAMEGVLSEGETVMVNIAETTPRSGFIYVLRQGSELLVKYCQQLPGGMLRISSANPALSPYDVDPSNTRDFEIIGRVVTSLHEW